MRTRLVIGILALALVPASLATPAPTAAVTLPDTTPATIVGAVVGPDGLPATGVTVTAVRYQDTYAYSYCQTRVSQVVDAAGHYSFTGLVPGVYALAFEGGMDFLDRAAAPDQRGDFVVAAPGSTVTAPTTPLSWAAKITGRTRTATGIGLRAPVWPITPPPTGNSATIVYGASGRFVVGGLPPGAYFLAARGVGKYYGQAYWSSYSYRTRTRINTAAHRTAVLRDMVLRAGAITVTGRVVDRYYRPVVGAKVEVWAWIGSDVSVDKFTTTNKYGRYAVSGVPPGHVTVTVTKLPTLLPHSVSGTGYPGRTLTLNMRHLRTAPRVTTIYGLVTLPDGSPAAGVPVRIVRSDEMSGRVAATVLTSTAGTYRVGSLPPWSYRVQFGADGPLGLGFVESSTAWFSMAAGQIRRVDGHVRVGGTITGVVRSTAGGMQFRPQVLVTQQASPYSVFWTAPAADGSYALRGLPSADYRVDAGACGYDVQYWDHTADYRTSTTLTVALGSTVSGIDFDLVPMATVSGQVTGPDGRGVAGADVTLTVRGTEIDSATTGWTGRYALPATVPAGDYVITVTPPASRPDLVTTAYDGGAAVTISPGEFRSVDVALQAGPPA